MGGQKKWKTCADLSELLPMDQRQRLARERAEAEKPCLFVRTQKRKNQKVVTLVLHLQDAPETYLKKLKKNLGCGGSLVKGVLEIQGDHRERTIAFFRKAGFRVKEQS